jgi:hypothetical protein
LESIGGLTEQEKSFIAIAGRGQALFAIGEK